MLKGRVDDVRFYQRTLSAEDARLLTLNDYWPILLKSRGQRNEEERAELQRFYKETYAVDYLRSEAALAEARKRKEDLAKEIPTTQIMEEMNPPRDTFLLVRGDFRNKGEKVAPGTPAILPPLPEGPTNRLSLARWLVSKEHPLTARVTVNRYWAMFFGNGLVKTLNDFGSQGEWPSHPELLDWLSCEFRDGSSTDRAWDMKHLVRLIVSSAAYRQDGRVTPEKYQLDPENRADYEKNLAAFNARVDAKLKEWAPMVARMKGIKVATYHKSWTYMSQWLGLEEIGYVEPKPGIPTDPQHLARLIAVMKQEGAQLLLVEDFYNKSVASLVAQKAGAKMLTLPTDVGATPQIKDWFSLVETVLKALSAP